MEELILFFAKYKQVSVGVHVFAVLVGMGSALISDALFNRFIADFRIDKIEHGVFSKLSKIIWISLLFMVISGVAIFMSDVVGYSASDKFLAKMTIVSVVIVNGIFFRLFIDPSLKKINFSDTNGRHKYVKIRKLSFAFGAISAVSWLSACALALYKGTQFSYGTIMLGYLIFIVIAVFCSQVLERIIVRRALRV